MRRDTHRARWDRMRDDAVVTKSRAYAKFTVPYLLVDTEDIAHSTQTVPVERDYQELGPMLVNNLAAKLAGLLFPVGRPFFQVELTGDVLDAALENISNSELSAGLSRMEMDAAQQLFRNASYSQIILGLKHLIVTGNLLTFRDADTRRTLAFGLNQFTCRRDGRGNLLDCVLREYTYFDALDLDTQHQLAAMEPGRYNDALQKGKEVRVALYTRICRKPTESGKFVYHVSQEVEDVPIGKPGTYPEHLCPWQVITWNLQPGEHYARGLVEDYAGGFAKLSDMSLSATLYGIEMSKIVNLVSANSGSSVDQMARADMGQWVQGDAGTVSFHEAGAYQKLAALQAVIQETWGNLARAFMYTANTRQGERVTAFEIRQQALEAENTLGGVFSALAESWQVGLGHLLLLEVNPGILEGIVTKAVRVDIKSGISALGRSVDVQALLQATQDAVGAATLAQVDKRIALPKLLDLVYSGQSIDTTALFKSEAEMQQEEAAEAAMQGAEQNFAQAQLTGDLQQALASTTQQGA